MINTSFIQLLQTLEDKEFRAFYNFSKGVYPKQKVQLRLLSYLFTYKRAQKGWDKLNIGQAYLAAFQAILETRQHRKKLLNTLSDLNNWLIDYLIWKDIQQDTTLRKIYTAEIYRKRKLVNKFFTVLENLKKDLLASSKLDFFKALKLMLISHLMATNFVFKKKLADYVLDTLHYLDEFYLLAKLRFAGDVLNRKHLLNEETPVLFLEEVYEEVQKPVYKEHAHLQLYFCINQLSNQTSLEIYETAKKYLHELSFVDKTEALDVLLFLNNFISHQIRMGDMSFVYEQFALCKLGLQRALFIVNGEFLTFSFTNTVILAVYNKELDWAEKFVEKYGPYLPPLEREEIIAFSSARILIAKKAYDKALLEVTKISSHTFSLECIRRTLQIRCFYELNEPITLMNSYCTSFSLYLQRQKKVNKHILDSYKNFLKVFKMILQKKSSDTIKARLKERPVIVHKKWLEECLEKLD